MSDYDDSRRNWRDMDRKKDRSAHRKVDAKPATPQRLRSTRTYRDKLDSMFANGTVGEAVARLKGESPAEARQGTNQAKLAKRVRDAVDETELNEALDALLEEAALPLDADTLIKALEYRKSDVVAQALALLLQLNEEKPLRRVGVLKMKLQFLTDNHRDREVRVAANKLFGVLDR